MPPSTFATHRPARARTHTVTDASGFPPSSALFFPRAGKITVNEVGLAKNAEEVSTLSGQAQVLSPLCLSPKVARDGPQPPTDPDSPPTLFAPPLRNARRAPRPRAC